MLREFVNEALTRAELFKDFRRYVIDILHRVGR
jgi:hypothetical protein